MGTAVALAAGGVLGPFGDSLEIVLEKGVGAVPVLRIERTADGEQRWRGLQGVELGWPNYICLELEQRDGTARRVRVGGAAVLVGGGRIPGLS
ncbi:MAG TPA: hypothetical protein VNN09_06900 [Candidatus Competibacteraceae bacterium]|nr:hypothetical protein [Candidatus Competibacteraceae bacterium]